MKKIRLILVVMMVLVLASCQSGENNINNLENTTNQEEKVVLPEEAVEPDFGDFTGYLWEVSGGQGKVYLYGSIHMATEALYPLSEVVETSFDGVDHLVVEANIADVGNTMALAKKMMYTDSTIYDHLSEAGQKKYDAICEELGVNPKFYQQSKVWAGGSTLLGLQLMRSDYSANYGIDMYFLNQAIQNQMDILELEGVMFQLDLMDGFTDEQQEMMFIEPLGTLDETIAGFDELYQLFLSGDEEKMTHYLMEEDHELNADESVERAMLQDRNKGMADKIAEMLETGDDYFVVVGVAHYLGEESVIDYLGQMGYTIERK